MNSVLAAALILGFSTIAVFGIFSMNHGVGDHNGCIAAASQGKDCPIEAESFSFFNFHIDSFRNLATATFGEGTVALNALLALLIIGFYIGALRGSAIPLNLAVVSRRSLEELSHSPLSIRLNRWLALHENSPAIF